MASKPRKPRVSLTKAQRETAIGAELLSLCQSIASDGVLTNDEIVELGTWLRANRDEELTSIAFLFETVEAVIADRKVSATERLAIQTAIEKVLPPELRKPVVLKRELIEASAVGREHVAKTERSEKERAEREMNKPVASADFMVAGVHFEGRPKIIGKYAETGQRITLVRDPKNKFSPYATEVRLPNGRCIGYMPEEDAVEFSPFLDRGHPYWATIKKILTGGRVPIPVVRAYAYQMGSSKPEEPGSKPAPPTTPKPPLKDSALGKLVRAGSKKMVKWLEGDVEPPRVREDS